MEASQSQNGCAASPATSDAQPSASDIARDISGETVCGFRVAAYRETHPEHGDKYGHSYSEHWSTPSRNPAVTVERLFTEAQLREALSRLTHDDLCRLSLMFGRSSDLRTDQDIRINEWLKAQLAFSKAETK